MMHSATDLWTKQRAKCTTCAHLIHREADPEMRCRAEPARAGVRKNAYCIDARSTGSCGPKAMNWVDRRK